MTQERPTVLVVDDKRNMLSLLTKVLGKEVRVLTANSGADAVALLGSEPIAVVLCDLKMPEMGGIEVLRATKRIRPGAEFILMTAFATVGTAIEALRLGAFDYLTKPFEPDEARAVVFRALGRARPDGEETSVPREVLPGLIGRSAPMRELGSLVRRVADSTATALILGETGTGKERIARALHELSPRARQRFVPVNCAAIPADLLESELFGFVRGAFTGAARDRAGLFEEADRGTIFLDEIAEMPLSLQAKLTRALEEKAVRRVGEARERKVDVRIVAATHQDLPRMVSGDAFREDLWYRLNVAVIPVPPLRDRLSDIELLATHFVRDLGASMHGRRLTGLTQQALETLGEYDWPGNVRQLRAAIERACVVAQGGRVDVGDLPPEVRGVAADGLTSGLVELNWTEALEKGRSATARAYLEALLKRYDGNVGAAAEHAAVERESFYRLLRRYDVDAKRFRA